MFILSENRRSTEETGVAFERYNAYLNSVRNQFPPAALKLATSDWYFANDSRSPHDSWLESLQIRELSSGERHEIRFVEARIRLLASYHNGMIELHYPKVYSYSIERSSKLNEGHGDWLWDEFTLAGEKRLLHEIEWERGRWKIEADDVYYHWTDLVATRSRA